eukprot:Rmarinus@m.9233
MFSIRRPFLREHQRRPSILRTFSPSPVQYLLWDTLPVHTGTALRTLLPASLHILMILVTLLCRADVRLTVTVVAESGAVGETGTMLHQGGQAKEYRRSRSVCSAK